MACLRPLVGIRDHQPHAFEAALEQALEEARPERLRLRRAEAQAHDLAPAFRIDRHGDYGSDGDDPAALADLEVGGVEPEIRPLALQRPLEERADPLIDLLAELGDRALADP
jgi:hypothetical protein